MLRELYIQDIVLIDRLSINIGDGLTALTGETGAGKSILLDALGLATGGRAEKALVRQGAKSGTITATFDATPKHEVWSLLEENGLSAHDEGATDIILRRVQEADGRSRAFVNDQPVGITLLRTIGESLIEVHGQHQGQGFLQNAAHRELLDDFGGHEKLVQTSAKAWTAWRDVENELETRIHDREVAVREVDYLRHVVAELGTLAPEPAEEATLAARRTMLMAAEKIAAEIADAASILDDESMESKLSSVLGRIEKTQSQIGKEEGAELAAVIARVDTALTELHEARSAVSKAAELFRYDEDELNRTEERLFALRAAARKYNTLPDQLHSFLDKAVSSLEILEGSEADFASLAKRVTLAKTQFFKQATRLSAARRKAAGLLDKAVAKELGPLKLGKATFTASVEADAAKANAYGIDRIEFLISTNPGAPLGPLKQIASGGELSRFVLALKAALVAKENRTVIIFDEVDAGIGGAVADAVGERLAKLAAGAQVMVVTHSPQVAARAQIHFLVSKTGRKKVITSIMPLSPDERTEEIARMLSGAKVTSEARAAAAKLLAASLVTPKAKTKKKKAAAQ